MKNCKNLERIGKIRKIRGSGGGDDASPHVATEASDTLQSSAYLKLIDLLCEGEIEGLVNGAKSIFIDSTQLQNDDGSYNFDTSVDTFSIDVRNGTQSQSYIDGFSAVENEVTVGTEFKYGLGSGGAIVRQITNQNLDRIRVRVSFPSLTATDPSNGDINGTSVSFSVWLQPFGGAFSQAATKTVTGKSSSKYEVSIEFDLTGTGPWNIRVQRDSADATTSYTNNKTVFESYTEIVDAKLRYPNSALVGLQLAASQFQSVPDRYYDVKLLRIQVPTNYDPATRTYSGVWDGTFKVAWSDNPAWVFYDLVTSERYGLGAYLAAYQIDKWELYSIAQYCDTLVPDGFGEWEPRFTCNLLLSDRADAYTVLQNLASVFRGMIYWTAGSVSFTQDAPQDPTYLFTNANVVDGLFTYQGSSLKTRHTVALVTWNDPDNFYKTAVEYVEDQDGIAAHGVLETQVTAMGCTSRGQAHRLGKWLLYTEQNENETLTFRTGLDGVMAIPGQIISVADPARAGARMGGRISSATTTTVTLDQAVDFTQINNTLSVLLPDGTVCNRKVIAASGFTLTVDSPYTLIPKTPSVWVLQSATLKTQLFRVIGVKEEDASTISITALAHDPSKFDYIENNIVLEPKTYSILTAAPSAPVNLVATESLYQSAAEVKTKVTLSWDIVRGATSYLVSYKIGDSNYVDLPETSNTEVEILDAAEGFYTFEVSALNSLGKQSAYSTTTKEVFGKSLPPADVTNFSMLPSQGLAVLTWDQATDLDVLVGGSVRVRFTPRLTGQAWKDATDLVSNLAGTSTSAITTLMNGTYMIKFIDSSGNFSVNEDMIETTVPEVDALNVVYDFAESPSFLGVKQSMEYSTLGGGLTLSSTLAFDSILDLSLVSSFDHPGPIASYGQYDFKTVIDLGGVWPSRILSTIDLEAYDVANYIDERLDLMDDWTDIDGLIVNDVNAELYLQTTNDAPTSTSAVWTDWKKLTVAEYSARGIRFELRCMTGNPSHNLYIKTLAVRIDMEDRTVSVPGLTSSTSVTTHVAITEPFYQAPTIGVTGQNLVSGDYFQYSNLTASGFDIDFFNSSGARVARNFSIIAKGFGRKVA